ncbi:MAG TPA: VWA domain-containing protein, partial [Bryobacteraceae bacterium]|nr:VWA domain-containing protein [Bryobacteraceae bacterium]
MRLLVSIVVTAVSAFAQTAEVTTKESPVTFRSGINLIAVPVIVRDSKGRPVDNLTADDFRLSDNGKPQMISKFSIERLAQQAAPPRTSNQTASASAAPSGPDAIPSRFVAYIFDDIHMELSGLASTRDAVRRQIDSTNNPLERIAIYSTSGIPTQEFTSDKKKLNAALDALNIGKAAATKAFEELLCPPMSYYQADRILNWNDPQATGVAAKDLEHCRPEENAPETTSRESSQRPIMGSAIVRRAREIVQRGDLETEDSLAEIRNVIARLASMPGQRIAVLISPGFLVTNDFHDRQTDLI